MDEKGRCCIAVYHLTETRVERGHAITVTTLTSDFTPSSHWHVVPHSCPPKKVHIQVGSTMAVLARLTCHFHS